MGLRGTSVDATATVPAVADAETTASGDVTTILTELVARSEAKVTSAEINVDAALDINSQTLENVTNMELVPASTPASTANRIYIDSGDSEWYINGVQLTKTAGTALNVTTASGAIGGDYGSGDETFNYNSAAVSYEALSDASPSKTYAKVDAGDVRLFEHNSAVTNNVSLKSPGSLAGSYSLVMPAALPAAEVVSSIDASGNVAVTDVATPKAAYKHATTEFGVPLLNWNAGTGTWALSATQSVWNNTQTSSSQILYIPVDLAVGERLDTVSININGNAASLTISLEPYKVNASGQTSLATAATTAGTGVLTVTGIAYTAVALDTVYFAVSLTGAATNDLDITYGSYHKTQA